MWAVPSTLPVSSLSFLSSSTINHSSLALFSAQKLLHSFLFYRVYRYSGADLPTVFYWSSLTGSCNHIFPLLFILYTSHIIFLSPLHTSLHSRTFLYYVFNGIEEKAHIYIMHSLAMSLLQANLTTYHPSVFQRYSLGGRARRWGLFSGVFLSKKNKNKTSCHSVPLSQMASV